MATNSRSIKCSKCSVFTTNSDYCKNCGELISYQKKKEIKEETVKQEMVAEEKWKLENPSWVERLKKHPKLLYRLFGQLIFSVVFVVSAIGSLLAWGIAMLAAG